MLTLDDPVNNIPLVGPVQSQKLKRLKIETVKDFLRHYPHRYEDFSQIKLAASARVGENVTIKGTPSLASPKYTRGGKRYTLVYIKDQSGYLQALWWNQPWIRNSLKPNQEYRFSGKLEFFNKNPTLINPQFESANSEAVHTSSLVPIYPETEGLSSKWLRSRIAAVLTILGIKNINEDQSLPSKIEIEYLPETIRQKYNLIYLPQALSWIHFPKNQNQAHLARQRLAFDELFQLQLRTQKRRQTWKKKVSAFNLDLNKHKKKIKDLITSLPFKLTSAQKRVTQQIIEDLQDKIPMNRLLQGDVGSGKTVVAAIAAYATYQQGFNTLFMAPTEILAQQHYQTLKQIFKHVDLNIKLLTGNYKDSRLEQGNIIIGTHALFYQISPFKKVGLTVIDEQHRFGVKQRATLVKKAETKKTPHILSLTATPIPRSVALTLYGDQDISILDQMPPGRKPVKTWVVSESKRTKAILWVKKLIVENGFQAFIICPFIEESEHETLQSVKAATVEFKKLKKDYFHDLNLGLIHGKLKSEDKSTVLDRFHSSQLDILVATPVVEVGLDIPKANIMIIEGAERFGLASLHQLRGRIGRRGQQAYCLLFTTKASMEHNQRLKALETNHSGLRLAEIDLNLRGPGELFGTKQHGFWDLKLASLNDLKAIEESKEAMIEYMKRNY